MLNSLAVDQHAGIYGYLVVCMRTSYLVPWYQVPGNHDGYIQYTLHAVVPGGGGVLKLPVYSFGIWGDAVVTTFYTVQINRIISV